jgi:hypothetical protein
MPYPCGHMPGGHLMCLQAHLCCGRAVSPGVSIRVLRCRQPWLRALTCAARRRREVQLEPKRWQVDAAVLRLHSRRCTCLEFHPSKDNLVLSGAPPRRARGPGRAPALGRARGAARPPADTLAGPLVRDARGCTLRPCMKRSSGVSKTCKRYCSRVELWAVWCSPGDACAVACRRQEGPGGGVGPPEGVRAHGVHHAPRAHQPDPLLRRRQRALLRICILRRQAEGGRRCGGGGRGQHGRPGSG